MTHIKLLTWNLRYDSKPDKITLEETLSNLPDNLEPPKRRDKHCKEEPWSTRRIYVAKHLLNSGIIVAGFQEALQRQVDDVAKILARDGEEWKYVGVGRDDGISAGEFSPIFYNSTHLELLKSDTFWLSRTPFSPGTKFPGAGSVRICTAARYRIKSIGSDGASTISILNTHLDDQSEGQRKLGASLILHRIAFEVLDHKGPVILLGDFNSSMSGKSDSGAYRIITGASQVEDIPLDFASRFPVPSNCDIHMIDMRKKTEALRVSGDFATFTGFKLPESSESGDCRIDFVFGDNMSKWSSLAYGVPSCFSDGVLASDHRPVFVTAVL